jgi:hypothetical protein
VVLASLETAKPQRKQLASLLEPVAIDHILTSSNASSLQIWGQTNLEIAAAPSQEFTWCTLPKSNNPQRNLPSSLGKKAPLRRFQTSLFVVFSVDFRRFSQLEVVPRSPLLAALCGSEATQEFHGVKDLKIC